MHTAHGNMTLDEVVTVVLLTLLFLVGCLIAMLAPVTMYDLSTLFR